MLDKIFGVSTFLFLIYWTLSAYIDFEDPIKNKIMPSLSQDSKFRQVTEERNKRQILAGKLGAFYSCMIESMKKDLPHTYGRPVYYRLWISESTYLRVRVIGGIARSFTFDLKNSYKGANKSEDYNIKCPMSLLNT